MKNKDTQAEVLYRLCKLLLVNMVQDGALSSEEAEIAHRGIQNELQPIIGCLDDGVCHVRD